jgi:mRNA interferase MazF
MSPRPGEVWLADLGLAAKTRPIVIVSRHDPEAPRALTIYVPLTTQNRGSRYEVDLPRLPFLRTESVANVQGVGSLPVTRLDRKLGELPDAVIHKIHHALRFAFDIN